MQTEGFARHPVLRGYWYAVAQSSDVAPGPLAGTAPFTMRSTIRYATGLEHIL